MADGTDHAYARLAHQVAVSRRPRTEARPRRNGRLASGEMTLDNSRPVTEAMITPKLCADGVRTCFLRWRLAECSRAWAARGPNRDLESRSAGLLGRNPLSRRGMKHLRGGRIDFRHLARPPRRDPFGRRVAERGQFLNRSIASATAPRSPGSNSNRLSPLLSRGLLSADRPDQRKNSRHPLGAGGGPKQPGARAATGRLSTRKIPPACREERSADLREGGRSLTGTGFDMQRSRTTYDNAPQ
jgi:hypothetical protein